MFEKLRHWLIPRHTNNYRAKLLHNVGLTVLIAAFISFTAVTRLLQSSALHILGFASSITISEVITQTNQERLAHGLPALNVSSKLSQAAAGKAQDMFINSYWAHTSPSGITPWVFILDAGYDYVFAGENLAKDFSNTSRMMQAWMDSPTHRANIISDKYSEIGIAVVPGNLNGEDTVLVVQMFGASGQSVGEVSEQAPTATAISVPEIAGEVSQLPQIAQIEEPQKIVIVDAAYATGTGGSLNQFDVKKTASIVTTTLMIAVLLLDLVIAESKNLKRRVSKNWAHLIFINIILIAITMINAGHIL